MIRIDNEFESLIPPLSAEEFEQLERNVVKEGVRDPLVVWPQEDGADLLIDGHNRWKIVVKHGGIPFDLKKMKFSSRDEAKRWIILNQFGRRNLSAYDRSLLALKLKPVIAEKAKENERLGGKGSQKSVDHKADTQKELATIAGVSHDTIHKVETIENSGDEDVKKAVRSGEISINQGYQAVKPAPKIEKKDSIADAHIRHMEYKENKVATIEAAKRDANDRELLARRAVTDLQSCISKIATLTAFNDNQTFSDIERIYSNKDRMQMIDSLKRCISSLSIICRSLYGGTNEQRK